MIVLRDSKCEIRIGMTNNWRRMHGFPMISNKRWKNERKDLPKRVRIGYHARIKAGCGNKLLKSWLEQNGFEHRGRLER